MCRDLKASGDKQSNDEDDDDDDKAGEEDEEDEETEEEGVHNTQPHQNEIKMNKAKNL